MWGQIVIASVASALTFILAREYVKSKNFVYLALAAPTQFVLLTMYVRLLRTTTNTNLFSIIKVISVLMVFGYGMRTEAVTWHNTLGILCAIGGLYLLNL